MDNHIKHVTVSSIQNAEIVYLRTLRTVSRQKAFRMFMGKRQPLYKYKLSATCSLGGPFATETAKGYGR